MSRMMLFLFSTIAVLLAEGSLGYVESLAGNVDVSTHQSVLQVAMICGDKSLYHNKYMSKSTEWVTDFDKSAVCFKNKVDILKYCQKVYPDKKISNIVESSTELKITAWCKVGQTKCKTPSHWVKPYRCLEAPFQSDPLLVPDDCQFMHIHNESECWEYQRWNQTASVACTKVTMTLRSFAMLLPCGIDLFRGVEFVCCPNKKNGLSTAKSPKSNPASKTADEYYDDDDDLDYGYDYSEDYNSNDDDEDEDSSDYGDSDEDNLETDDGESLTPKVSTTKPTEIQPTPDPYFTLFDARHEHEAFKGAENRLEEHHKQKVTKVMKDWSDLEERYQELLESDPKGADKFKKEMTVRFQKKVAALEEEGEAEKRQLISMHQQRIMANINQKKKDAMICYTKSLNMSPPVPHKVEKCLQKLLRALNKDRHHTLSHYKHLLSTDFLQADRQKDLTIEHLTDLDRMVNQSLAMLHRYPSLASKLSPLMEDLLRSLRSKDSAPGHMTTINREAEETLIDTYHKEYAARYQAKIQAKEVAQARKIAKKDEGHREVHREQEIVSTTAKPTPIATPEHSDAPEPSPMYVKQHEVPVAHIQSHTLSHSQATFSLTGGAHQQDHRSMYFTLAFAGVALMLALVVGIVVLRRRNLRSPHHQGFVEVDQAITPEEKHVTNMQINGYENPTYKYFEAQEA